MTATTPDPHVRPGEPSPVIAADLCAVSECGGPGDHLGDLTASLAGGYSRPAVDVVLQLPLCFEHAAVSHDGLSVRSWTPPALG